MSKLADKEKELKVSKLRCNIIDSEVQILKKEAEIERLKKEKDNAQKRLDELETK